MRCRVLWRSEDSLDESIPENRDAESATTVTVDPEIRSSKNRDEGMDNEPVAL